MKSISQEKLNILKETGHILWDLATDLTIDDELAKQISEIYYKLGKIVEKVEFE